MDDVQFGRQSLNDYIQSAQSLADLAALEPHFDFPAIKSHLMNQINSMADGEVLAACHDMQPSINDLLIPDMLQYMLRFTDSFTTSAVCREWEVLNIRNELQQLRVEHLPIVRNHAVSIFHQGRRLLTAAEHRAKYTNISRSIGDMSNHDQDSLVLFRPGHYHYAGSSCYRWPCVRPTCNDSWCRTVAQHTIILHGSGVDTTTLALPRMLHIGRKVVFENMRIELGKGAFVSARYSHLTLRNCDIIDKGRMLIIREYASLTLQNCRIICSGSRVRNIAVAVNVQAITLSVCDCTFVGYDRAIAFHRIVSREPADTADMDVVQSTITNNVFKRPLAPWDTDMAVVEIYYEGKEAVVVGSGRCHLEGNQSIGIGISRPHRLPNVLHLARAAV